METNITETITMINSLNMPLILIGLAVTMTLALGFIIWSERSILFPNRPSDKHVVDREHTKPNGAGITMIKIVIEDMEVVEGWIELIPRFLYSKIYAILDHYLPDIDN